MKPRSLVLRFALVVLLVSTGFARAAEGPYHLAKEIAVGGEGGWDYLSVDSAAHRLYVAHATRIMVIDLDKGALAGEVTDVEGAHGFAVAADIGRGFASAGRANKVSIVDLKTLQTLSKVPTAENPDAILYDPGHKEIWAFGGRGRAATVIDATSGEVRATVPLPGKPEFAVLDLAAGRIYDNLEDTNMVAVLDTASHKLVTTWALAPGEEPSGLALDVAHHRLFAGCANKLMVMMDSTTGKILSSVPIGPGVDANAFDPGTGFAFASSSDGTLTVAKVNDKGVLEVVQTLTTPQRSRTMTLDPRTHALFVATAQFGPPASPGPDGRPGRPQVVPGSFKVLVFEMKP
jgi:DNA-binding beta-propeller fold protein YncE